MLSFDVGTQKVALGVYDPLSAHLAEQAGSPLLWLSSFSYCKAQGYPDLGVLPFTGELSVVARILRIIRTPLIVDIDNAYGTIDHAINIVDSLVALGVGAVCIEDKKGPKFSTLYPHSQELLQLKTYQKLLSVLKLHFPSVCVLARLEGLVYGQSESEVSDRVAAALDAGADCAIIHYKNAATLEPLRRVLAANPTKPLGLIPTCYMDSLDSVQTPNVSLLIYANQLLRAVSPAIKKISTLLLSTPEVVDSHITPLKELTIERRRNEDLTGESH